VLSIIDIAELLLLLLETTDFLPSSI